MNRRNTPVPHFFRQIPLSDLFLPLVFVGLLAVPPTSLAIQPLPKDWSPAPADLDTTGFALILGGGGARGIAHIAVIEVLEEMGMRPSLIVGTSMGSVIGSLYSSGTSSSELRSLALGQDLMNLLVDVKTPPAELQGGWWGPAPHQIRVQITQWPPLPHTGFSHGQGFESLVGEETANALFAAGNDFDNLPIAFRCVSTDLLSSSLVVHDEGMLPRAVKASSTIPMIFYPVELEGRQLVDGGFLDNLPVQVARRLGFDRAVLVDVSNVHLPDKKEPHDLYEMWIRMAQLQTLLSNEYTVGDHDVLLKMPLESYRGANMDAAKEILAIGREVALQHKEELLALRDACGTVVQDPPPQKPVVGPVTLRAIEVRGLHRLQPGRVLDRLQMHPGERMELAAAWGKAEWLAREGSFQTIGFEFERVASDTADVVLHVQEETSPRLELGASVITDDGLAAMGRLRYDNIFGRAGSSLLSYRYSYREARFNGLLDQPLNGPGWLGLRARFLWQRELPGVYDNGLEVDHFVFRRTQLGLDLTVHTFQRGWSLYLGGDVGQTSSYLESRRIPGTGNQPLQTFHLTLESHGRDLPVSQPLRGARIRYVHSFGDTGDQPQWWRMDLGLVLPVGGLGSWRPVWAAGAVASSADIPVVHQGRAGDPRGWVGLRRQEIIAPQIAWSRGALQYLLGDGLHLEAAGAVGWHGQENLSRAQAIWGGGLEVGMNSIIGPLRLGFAVAERRPGYVYLQVGHAF